MRGRQVLLPKRPLIMGILNINHDSFSGDGRVDLAWAQNRAKELIAEGADFVDIGGESARTNRAAISEEEEWLRISPFLERFPDLVAEATPRDASQIFPPLLSVNTWRTEVVKRALQAGCDLLNDMSALPEDTHARLCADHGTALLIMHSQGQPKIPHPHVKYEDILSELEIFFESRIAMAMAAGLPREAIVLDPGIDFAKQTLDNLRIYRELSRLHALGRPLLIPVSRKSTIGRVLDIEDPSKRDAGTMACIVAGSLRGASIFRVHNVHATWQTLQTLEKLGCFT